MSQEINTIFSNFKSSFVGREEEIKKFLLRHYKNVFKNQIIQNVERIDSTNRIKTAGFHPELSSWRNTYQNIIVCSCEVIKGKQKRYDYKFYFVEEKLDDKTVENIENALDEASRLLRRFNFDEAIAKVDEMIELIRLEEDEVYNKRLYDFRRDIVLTKEKYEKGLEQIQKLEEKVKESQEKGDLKAVISNSEKIVETATSIKRKDLAKKYSDILEQAKKELEAFREIEILKKRINLNRTNERFDDALKNCEKIIELAESINRDDLVEKYRKINEEIQKDIENTLKKIAELEKSFNQNKENKDLKAAMSDCIKIIKLSKSVKKDDLVEKYTQLKGDLKKELSVSKEEYDKLFKKLKELEKEFKKNREKGNLTAALKDCEKIIELADSIDKLEMISKYSKIYEELLKGIEDKESDKEKLKDKVEEVKQIIEIEENVLPLVEEFSVDDILGDLSGDINDSLDQIDALLKEHRVEVKEEIAHKVVLTSVSGEVKEIEKNIEVEKFADEESPIINVQSGFENPFDDVIEDAIITDLIPYNYEIVNVELNGKPVKKLPDSSLTEDGLELNWKLKNIKPKERVDINYNLRRRISRTLIFVLENQLKIVKTHSNLSPLELEGMYEARLPFTNSYGTPLNGVIVEDIIPMYYLHFIKDPTDVLPEETSSKAGDLVKWNVGTMKKGTLNYHYKLLDIYRFEELKALIEKLTKEALYALHKDAFTKSLGKYSEIRDILTEYLK